MNIDLYKRQYHTFIAALHQANLVHLLTGHILEEFPAHLPEHLRASYNDEIGTIINVLENAADDKPVEIDFRANNSVTLSVVIIKIATDYAEIEPPNVDFSKIASYQHLVMIIALLEAFLIDSIKAICIAKPQVMKSSQRTVDWQTIIEAGDFDKIVQVLAEKDAQTFIEHSRFSKVAATLRKRFGLKVNVSDASLSLLDNARNLRHLIVHNGGRVDSKYKQEANRPNLAIGQTIDIDIKWLQKITNTSMNLAVEIFTDIANKFYEVDLKSLKVLRPEH